MYFGQLIFCNFLFLIIFWIGIFDISIDSIGRQVKSYRLVKIKFLTQNFGISQAPFHLLSGHQRTPYTS